MCNPAVVMFAAAAVQSYGAGQQAKAAKSAANTEAADIAYQGALARDQGEAEAARIRRAGDRARGETVAAVAASGVKVGEGSALDAERTVMQDYEQDAAISILNGQRQGRVMDLRAAGRRRAGRTSADAAYTNLAGSLLSQGGAMWGGG